MRALGYQRTGSDQHIVFYHGMIQDDCAHADQHSISDSAAVYDSSVSDGYIIANLEGRLLIGAVKHSAILNIGTITDADEMHISPDHHMVPDAACFSDYDIPDDYGSFCDEGILSDLWDLSEERTNNRHRSKIAIRGHARRVYHWRNRKSSPISDAFRR